ncbi:MAG: GNAT family N-acetyltransferase [Nitrosomonas sp.]|nr:GNAT family N-acetyltransferase [Nitrosomonas sp.]
MSENNRTVSELLHRALRCYQSGQFEQAERHCLNIYTVAPEQPDALHLLAIIYAQGRKFPLANDYFEKAIAANPERADFYSNYGNALWEQGCFKDAIRYCQQSLEYDSSNAGTYNILGSILLSQNRLSEAADSFRKALAIQPRYPQALNNLGNTLQKMKKTEDAIVCYRNALALQENYPEAHNNLGMGLKQLDRIEEARTHFLRAVALRPDFVRAKQNCMEVDPAWLVPLDGKQLYLRRYKAEDAAFLHQCYLDAAFMDLYNRYIPRHQQVDDLAATLSQAHKKHPCQLKTVDWVIFRKAIHKPVGIANLVDIQYQHRRAEFQIGLPNSADHTRGIGLEATLLVLDYAFNRIGLNKLVTVIYGHNVSSQRNSLALGFVQESYLREQLMDKESGKFIDLYGNGMTLRDFRQNKRLSRLSKRLIGRDIVLAADCQA